MIVNNSNVNPIQHLAPETGRASTPVSTRPMAAEDTIEFSPLGRALAQGTSESTLRTAQIRAIRTEIENGTYETATRIDRTVDRLLNILA